MSDDDKKPGRITKVILADSGGSPIVATSYQEPDDPFAYGANGLQEPPFSPEKLLKLAESHPTHGAAIEQKTSDIAQTGWDWLPKQDGADLGQKAQLEEWFLSLADPKRDETVGDIISAAWGDVETIGYGGVEIARDGENNVRRIYPVSSHMVRFHKNGTKLAQGQTGKRTWFKRWVPGDTTNIGRKDGKLLREGDTVNRANELLILRRPSRRSSHYGVPGYVSAIGWIYLSLSARDDNIHFFNNRREPRWAIILTNIEDEGGDLEEQLRTAFSTSLKDPHRNIFIPIEGEGKIDFKQLSSDTKDVSFDRLQERASSEILLGHRMPPDRLGAVRVGPLGGNATMAASRVYKEAVVRTSQGLLSDRMNRFIAAEGPVDPANMQWTWAPKELDLTEEAEDVQTISVAFQANLLRLDEARQKLKLPAVGGDVGKKFFFELAPQAAQAAAAAGAAARAGASFGADTRTTSRAGTAPPGSNLHDAESALSAKILSTIKP